MDLLLLENNFIFVLFNIAPYFNFRQFYEKKRNDKDFSETRAIQIFHNELFFNGFFLIQSSGLQKLTFIKIYGSQFQYKYFYFYPKLIYRNILGGISVFGIMG